MGKAESQSKIVPTSNLEDLETRLNDIKTAIDDIGDVGIPVWGTTEKKEQDQYRVLKVNDEGEVLADNKDREIGRTAPSLKTAFGHTVSRDANGRISQIVVTDGVTTKTIDITRNADGRLETKTETIS